MKKPKSKKLDLGGHGVWYKSTVVGKKIPREGFITTTNKGAVSDVFISSDGKISVMLEITDTKAFLNFAKKVCDRGRKYKLCLTHFNPELTIITRTKRGSK